MVRSPPVSECRLQMAARGAVAYPSHFSGAHKRRPVGVPIPTPETPLYATDLVLAAMTADLAPLALPTFAPKEHAS